MSTQVYDRLHESLSIPSLTLAPSGDDRSIMSCHLPGLFFLGYDSYGAAMDTQGLSLASRKPNKSVEVQFLGEVLKTLPPNGPCLPCWRRTA